MTDGTKAALTGAGIQVDEALERLMGSEALLERLLGKFLEDRNLAELTAALAEDRREDAFRAAHTLKGVCGNLSMTRLEALVSQMVELLRGEGELAAAQALLPEVTEACREVREAISGALS